MTSRLWQERERSGWCILMGSFLSLNQTSQRDEMNQAPATCRETVLCGCFYPPVRAAVRRHAMPHLCPLAFRHEPRLTGVTYGITLSA